MLRHETYTHLMILNAKNATANELQYVSNKPSKQTEIYIKTEFQNSIERLTFFCRITNIKIAWINPCV